MSLARVEKIADQFVSEKFERRCPLSVLDALPAALFFVLAWLEVVWLIEAIGKPLWRAGAMNVWFEADTPRVIANWTDITSNQYRTSVHPLSPTLLTLPVVALEAGGVPMDAAARALMIAVAALSGCLCYLMLRLLDLPMLAASVFTALFLGSATFIHWSPIPELNMPAMVTILLGLGVLLEGRIQNQWVWVLAGVATMGITITNWTVGLLGSLVRLGLRQALRVAAWSLAIVFVIALVQSLVLPGARLLSPRIAGEYRWTQVAAEITGWGVWDPAASVRSLLVTTISAPAVSTEHHGEPIVITNQRAGILDRTPLGIVVALSWLVLLGTGAYGLWTGLGRRSVAAAVFAMIGFQAALHSVYGDPTFLYAPHFLPMLLIVAAGSWFTPVRTGAVMLAGLIAAGSLVDNVRQFQKAAEMAAGIMKNGGNEPHPFYHAGGAVLP